MAAGWDRAAAGAGATNGQQSTARDTSPRRLTSQLFPDHSFTAAGFAFPCVAFMASDEKTRTVFLSRCLGFIPGHHIVNRIVDRPGAGKSSAKDAKSRRGTGPRKIRQRREGAQMLGAVRLRRMSPSRLTTRPRVCA